MIEGRENIAAALSALHDGAIATYLHGDSGLILIVEIPYLAKKISPSYSKFLVCLFGAQQVQFHTWPRGSKAPQVLTKLDEIFKPKLGIAQAELNGPLISVECSQTSDEFPYHGGELLFQADSATVADEGGKFWTLEDLEQFSRKYWDEWAKSAGRPH